MCQSILWVPECSPKAQTGPGALSSLLQLNPARSGPRSLAQLPKGPGKVPSFPEKLQGPGVLLSAQGCVQAKPRKNCYSSTVPMCPGLKSTCFLRPGNFKKTLSWAFILFILTFKKLKFYFSCFYLCSKEVRHMWTTLPVSHVCLQIAFPVSHIGFTISYSFSIPMVNWKRRLLCSWITATLKWYIGSYMLLPIDFNGKLEIFLKHLKKKIFFLVCMCEWLDFDYFSGIPTLGSSHVNFVFF